MRQREREREKERKRERERERERETRRHVRIEQAGERHAAALRHDVAADAVGHLGSHTALRCPTELHN